MELFERLAAAPILTPADVPPSRSGLVVRCVINPGAFMYQGRIGLLLRVCEQPRQEPDWVSAVVRDDGSPDGVRILRFKRDDRQLKYDDPRLFKHGSETYLTTLSHLRLAWSDDGRSFKVEREPAFEGAGPYETHGVEDVRVTELEGRYHLTYTAVSQFGAAVGHAVTSDFRNYERIGLIYPPHNKDCALFPTRIRGHYVSIHRPSGAGVGGHFMWISTSPDRECWGYHRCLARTRPDLWDCERVGVNGPPIPTDRGWLVLYHGSDFERRYALGAMLLDRDEPLRVLGRSHEPIMVPQAEWEKRGFFPNVVFSNGHVVRGDELTVYYGAADEYIGAARGSLKTILDSLA